MKTALRDIGATTRGKTFFMFIALLRMIATCLITNTHYDNIYPVSALAVGGLIGDVLFFAISGFCLINLETVGFGKWYGKRLIRIYPAVIVATAILCLLGARTFSGMLGFIETFIYPTQYHFVASILLLYIPFFPVAKIQALRKRIPCIMLVVAAVWLAAYLFCFDKTQRLDVAQIPITKFLFFEAMLFGAQIRLNVERYIDKTHPMKWLWLAVSAVLYLLSKIVIDRYDLMEYQFVIVLLVFSVSAALFMVCCSLDGMIRKRKWMVKAATFVAPLTLEIYVVQSYIIYSFGNLVFPLNFIVTTVLIVLTAYILNRLINLLIKGIGRYVERIHPQR